MNQEETTTNQIQVSYLPNMILSMHNEKKEKKDEFMERLHNLLEKYKYKVSSRKNEETNKEEILYGDLSCWYNSSGKLVALENDELPFYFKNVDDATYYRSKAFDYHIENVNLNHVCFDVKNNMKYNSNIIKQVYEKICKNNQSSDEMIEKNIFFEDAFKVLAEYNASLEIIITTEEEEESKYIAKELARGAIVKPKEKDEKRENKVLKLYKINVNEEKENVCKKELYKVLLKHKYHVTKMEDVFNFAKWYNKNESNSFIMKTLKYYFDDMIDDDKIRVTLFLLHRNKTMDDITKFYESDGMGYGKEEFIQCLENAEKSKYENANFYNKLFKLFIEYDIILKITQNSS